MLFGMAYGCMLVLLLVNFSWSEAPREPFLLANAAGNGNLAEVKSLLGKYPILLNGLTLPLLAAARNGHLEVVKLLIQRGANVNASYYGNTALIQAAHNGHSNIANLLIVNHADINAQTATEDTTLMCEAATGHWGIVRLLVAKGADINLRNLDGG